MKPTPRRVPVLTHTFLTWQVLLEGSKWGEFVALLTKSADFRYNIAASGLSFYLYAADGR